MKQGLVLPATATKCQRLESKTSDACDDDPIIKNVSVHKQSPSSVHRRRNHHMAVHHMASGSPSQPAIAVLRALYIASQIPNGALLPTRAQQVPKHTSVLWNKGLAVHRTAGCMQTVCSMATCQTQGRTCTFQSTHLQPLCTAGVHRNIPPRPRPSCSPPTCLYARVHSMEQKRRQEHVQHIHLC